MTVKKLSRKNKFLRKEILLALGKELPAKQASNLHWLLLDRLIQDLPCLTDGLRTLLTEVSANKSTTGYFQMQYFNDPQMYRSFAEYSSASAALSFLKKFPFGKEADLDPLEAAKRSFVRAERLCKITNRRLKWYRTRGYRHKNRWQGLHSVLHTARLLISGWLGPLDLNTVYDRTRHGPGGAVGVTGNSTTAYYKYAAKSYSVTTRALPYAESAILTDPLWRRYVVRPDSITGDAVPSVDESLSEIQRRLEVINYNKVTFVPKTAQTHRAIAIEPLMNIFLQLGVGDHFSQVLRSVGLNLKSQTRNQNLARDGSQWYGESYDRPVTIDLSMASDTLAIELVRELLPDDWFDYLNDIRSHFGSFDGSIVPWSKFSSMGNGFTFQLESMIFYALTLSVAKHTESRRDLVSVYGDDIICPANMALRLIDTLAYCGFRVNTSKSYFTGPFRESCGTDWFEGRDARPFFLKRKVKNAKDLVFVLNSFGGYHDLNDLDFNDSPVLSDNIRTFISSHLPALLRTNLLGPKVEDLEGHIHCPWDLAQKSRLVTWNRDYQTWSYVSAKSVPLKYFGDVGPIVLQMMDISSCRGTGAPDKPLRNGESFLSDLLALEIANDVAAPVSSGVVTRRASTKLRLATQTSRGWRND